MQIDNIKAPVLEAAALSSKNNNTATTSMQPPIQAPSSSDDSGLPNVSGINNNDFTPDQQKRIKKLAKHMNVLVEAGKVDLRN